MYLYYFGANFSEAVTPKPPITIYIIHLNISASIFKAQNRFETNAIPHNKKAKKVITLFDETEPSVPSENIDFIEDKNDIILPYLEF
jgi:hypothetical protein